MKKFVIPFCLLLFVSAGAHVLLLFVQFVMTRDWYLWNYFTILGLNHFIPSLTTRFFISLMCMIALYLLLYFSYSRGLWKRYLQ